MERRRWRSWEDHHLVFAYRHVPTRTIATDLGRTLAAVKNRTHYLGLARRTARWNSYEDEFLRRHYQDFPASGISKRLGRSEGGVYNRAFYLGLTRTVSRAVRRPWTAAEDKILREKYGLVRPLALAMEINRTRVSVWHRAKRIGLLAELGSGEYIRRQGLPRTAKPFTGLCNPGDRGYVAGIIDGEGSVGPPPRVHVSVTTTTRSLAVRLQELAGGSVAGPYRYHKTKIFGSRRYRVKRQYHWNYSSRAHVYLLLKAIQPYLVVKAQEAQRAIQYLEKKLGWSRGGADKT
jgi:hypothetical protein